MSSNNKKQEKTNFISKSAMKRIMQNQGAKIISDEVLELMISEIEKAGIEITKTAISNMKDYQRTKLMKKDIKFAVHELPYKEWDEYKNDLNFLDDEDEEED